MKKILMLGAAVLAFQALPALAEDGPKGDGHKGGKGIERMFEKQDTDKDGVVSEAEFMAHSKAKFTEMDANKDGKLTKEEGKAHHEAMKAKWKEKREQMKKEGVEKPSPEAAPAE